MVMVKFWTADKPGYHVSEEYGPFDAVRVGDDMMLGLSITRFLSSGSNPNRVYPSVVTRLFRETSKRRNTMDEIIRRNLVIFARAVYNDDAGISEEAHNAFLEVIEAAGGFIPGCPGDKQLFEELQDIRRLIDATDGRFYLDGIIVKVK